MDTLIDAIRSAVVDGASAEARASGVQACRMILTALEAKQGEPLAATPAPAPTTPVHAVIAALRNVPPDQLLDLAIEKLKAALPQGATPSTAAFVRFPIVPIGSIGGGS